MIILVLFLLWKVAAEAIARGYWRVCGRWGDIDLKLVRRGREYGML